MMAELKGGGLAWGINMSADALSKHANSFVEFVAVGLGR
jgi:hypothetical protein